MTRASQKGQEFIETMLHKASLPPGREERWKWAMRKTFSQDFSESETLEELITNDITTGEGDRANLKEATSDDPSLVHLA